MDTLLLRPTEQVDWDLIALGEVMLRFDPGESRISTTRLFHVWEGGGEYNVARGLKRTFGMRTAVVTAIVDSPVGRLLEDLMLQGGVDLRYVRWVPFDGIGKKARVGLNFTERGFGVRASLGCSDRANSAASQMERGDVDWKQILEIDGARWFHTGGIFAALSPQTAELALEGMRKAREAGTCVSFDLNFRPSLWAERGGPHAAQALYQIIAGQVDVLIGNEEDYTAALGFQVAGADEDYAELELVAYRDMLGRVLEMYPGVKLAAVTLRVARSASRNDWGACALTRDGVLHRATDRRDIEIFDRVGGGDSFASGFIYALLTDEPVGQALEYGAAHGALAMTTPGDTSMATLSEVKRLMAGKTARVFR